MDKTLVAIGLWVSLAVCILLPSHAYAQQEAMYNFSVEDYLNKSKAEEDAGRYRQASWYLNQIAMKRWEANAYQEAVDYFGKSLRLNERINNQQGILGIYSNLAMLHADMQRYEESLGYFEKTLAGRKKGGDKTSVIAAHINTSVVLNNMKRHKDAAAHLEDALKLATEMSDAEQMRSCYGMLSETHEKDGNAEKSLYYFNLYRTFHELVQREKEQGYKESAEQAQLKAQLLEAEKRNQALELSFKERALAEKERELQDLQDVLSKFDASNRKLLETADRAQLLQKLLEEQNAKLSKELEVQEMHRKAENTFEGILLASLLVALAAAIAFYRNSRIKKANNQKLQIAIEAEQLSREQTQLAYSQLQQAQNQLITNEKMASLGQLTAGIAHEMNNPLNFVVAGIEVVNANLQSYQEAIGKYVEAGNDPEKLLEAQRFYKKEGIADLQVETDEIFQSIAEGGHRIMHIVKSLQQFSRLGKAIETAANVNEGIEATLVLVNKEVKTANATIEKHYGDVGNIQCFPAQLNQVFMSLIVNALQAMPADRAGNAVAIETKGFDDHVEIRISDNGTGIPADILPKIFEPFFTTKDVGRGTGLGLSTSYGIIQDHQGEISVESQEGVGTAFTIRLPRKLAHA